MKNFKLWTLSFLLFVGITFIVDCKFNVSSPTSLYLLANLQKYLPRGATVSCDTPDSSTTALSIKGTIKNVDSFLVVPNARITAVITKNAMITDVNGAYKFSDIDSAITKETINVVATGYDTFSTEVSFNGCQNLKVNFNIVPSVIAAAGVNAFVLDSSALDSANIQ